MTRDHIMRQRLIAIEHLDDPEEAVREAAKIILRLITYPPKDFIEHRENHDA